MTHPTLDLFLFSTDCRMIADATAGGATGIVIDWESAGKRLRQAGADTQIGTDTVEDLCRVRSCTARRIICRTDRYGIATRRQIEEGIDRGADEVLLPMVRTVAEVDAVLNQIRGRIRAGILIETQEAVDLAADLAKTSVSRVYVGLNDLAIDRGSRCIFEALTDGTVEHVREYFDIPFGFGGLTLPHSGRPIPCRLLIAEMVRLHCDFSFLRRSFISDTHDLNAGSAVGQILDAVALARRRDSKAICTDRSDLAAAVRSWGRDSGSLSRGSREGR